MRTEKNLRKWIAVLAAIVMLAAACGDDGGTTDSATPDDTSSAGTGADDTGSDDSGSDDSGSDDMGSDDTGSDDMGSDDMGSDDMGSDDMGTDDTPPTGTTLDCAEVQAAIEAAGDFSTVDPSGSSGTEDLEASFNQSRAALAALGESAPEIAGEVEQALEGLDALGAVFAELNWDTDFSSNPQAALELAGAMGDSDILGMIGAMSAISAWIAESCSS